MKHYKEYVAFANMRYRVLQPTETAKRVWGDTIYSGMDIEEAWKTVEGFQDFLNEIGPSPEPTHYIDRIDNSHGYLRGNVKWSSSKESASNRNNRSRSYTVAGVTKTLEEWCKPIGIVPSALHRRLNSGKFTAEEAVSIPKNGRYKFHGLG